MASGQSGSPSPLREGPLEAPESQDGEGGLQRSRLSTRRSRAGVPKRRGEGLSHNGLERGPPTSCRHKATAKNPPGRQPVGLGSDTICS
jgi:hypothetical protein